MFSSAGVDADSIPKAASTANWCAQLQTSE
jgi:hypothetical protein